MKIINWQNTLFFPDDIELQYNAIHLLRWYVCFLLLLSVPSNVPHDLWSFSAVDSLTTSNSRYITYCLAKTMPYVPELMQGLTIS